MAFENERAEIQVMKMIKEFTDFNCWIELKMSQVHSHS